MQAWSPLLVALNVSTRSIKYKADIRNSAACHFGPQVFIISSQLQMKGLRLFVVLVFKHLDCVCVRACVRVCVCVCVPVCVCM